MTNPKEALYKIIRDRRTVKPDKMNGQAIPEDVFMEVLSLADWAPTHGNTEPWRFFIYSGDKVTDFCKQHADLYAEINADDKYNQSTYDKLLNMGNGASHIAIAVMQRGNLPKIPVLEEIAATSAAVQNILLGAEANGIAAYWGSGGMILHPAMKQLLLLREEDVVLGALYFGYTSEPKKEGVRKTPLREKFFMM